MSEEDVKKEAKEAYDATKAYMGSSSGNVWEQLKSGIDAAMEDLGNAYKKAAAELSKS